MFPKHPPPANKQVSKLCAIASVWVLRIAMTKGPYGSVPTVGALTLFYGTAGKILTHVATLYL